MPLPPVEIRDAAAEACHRAVCSVTGDDGCGHCDLYALAGYALLPAITGQNWMPHVGNFSAVIDPPNGRFEICAEQGGLDRGEFHCWLGLPGRDTGQRENGVRLFEPGQLVDFSLRHLRAMCARMPQIQRVVEQNDERLVLELAQDVIQHTRTDDFPPYLWVTGGPPDNLTYAPDLSAMQAFAARFARQGSLLRTLRDRTLREYAALARASGLPTP